MAKVSRVATGRDDPPGAALGLVERWRLSTAGLAAGSQRGRRARARHLFWALRLLYASLGAFAAAALIAVLGSASTFLDSVDNGWTFQIAAALGRVAGTVGVGGLLAGCGLMVHEVRLALQYIAEETEPTDNRAAIL